MAGAFSRRLITWYQHEARQLPWRDTTDSYAILVSEVMLQQTRVDTVIPYYLRWMDRFPTLKSLAQTTEDEVLRVWEGLGYYSRARNLHKTAQVVLLNFDGVLPRSIEDLANLPGIGAYTAGAVASIAFGMDEISVDANIRRVAARLFDLVEPLGTPALEKMVRDTIQAHLPPGNAGQYNQALMELGACVCTPRQPDCTNCPVQRFCLAFQQGLQENRPVKNAAKSIPHYQVTAAVIWQDEKVLLAKRPASGLLAGMWEFPGGKLLPGETHSEGLGREILEELGAIIHVGEQIGVFRHAYTHFKVTLFAYHCVLAGKQPVALEAQEIRWVDLDELVNYPMGKIDRQIAMQITQNDNQII